MTLREKAASLLKTKRFEYFIAAIIIFNAITLGLETSESVMAKIGPLLIAIDRFILGIFVIELLIRFYVHRTRFFHDPWRIFDFTIVTIALIPATGGLSVLRALRILRVLRLVSIMPSLRRVVGGLIAALPGMGSIMMLMVLVFYVYAVMATKLYGDNFPQWFGTLGASAYSLFQIMTLESWSMGIVRPVLEQHPFAWAFFIPFILSTTFTVLNLFIGIIVSAMQEEHDEQADEQRAELSDQQSEILKELQALRTEVKKLKSK